MTTKEPEHGGDDFQKRIQDALRRGNMTFMFDPAAAHPHGTDSAAGRPPVPDAEDKTDEVLRRIQDFSLKPREVRDYLDRFVVKQDEAKKQEQEEKGRSW